MFPPDPSFLGMSRPALAAWLSAFVLGTIGILAWFGPADWGFLQIGVGGVVLGAMSFYMLFINRILVS